MTIKYFVKAVTESLLCALLVFLVSCRAELVSQGSCDRFLEVSYFDGESFIAWDSVKTSGFQGDYPRLHLLDFLDYARKTLQGSEVFETQEFPEEGIRLNSESQLAARVLYAKSRVDLSSAAPPTSVIFVAGVHGNEPMSVVALLRVLQKFNSQEMSAFLRKQHIQIHFFLNLNPWGLFHRSRYASKAQDSNGRNIDDMNRLFETLMDPSIGPRAAIQDLAGRKVVESFQGILDGILSRSQSIALFLDLHGSFQLSEGFLVSIPNPDSQSDSTRETIDFAEQIWVQAKLLDPGLSKQKTNADRYILRKPGLGTIQQSAMNAKPATGTLKGYAKNRLGVNKSYTFEYPSVPREILTSRQQFNGIVHLILGAFNALIKSIEPPVEAP